MLFTSSSQNNNVLHLTHICKSTRSDIDVPVDRLVRARNGLHFGILFFP